MLTGKLFGGECLWGGGKRCFRRRVMVIALADAGYGQLLGYLKATECEVGLVLTFGRRPDQKRVVFTKTR